MQVIIPLWFYEYGSVMYLFAATIGILLSYFSYRIFELTKRKYHQTLAIAFFLITAGFVALEITNTYNFVSFESCAPSCQIPSSGIIYERNIVGNYIYYITSIGGYILLAMSYRKLRIKIGKIFPAIIPAVGINILIPGQDIFIFYPFETSFFLVFHAISIVLLAYIAFKTGMNYVKTRDYLSFLVFLGFAFMMIYHILMYALSFSATFFALAHFSLLLGFISLLYMLVKVRAGGRAKI